MERTNRLQQKIAGTIMQNVQSFYFLFQYKMYVEREKEGKVMQLWVQTHEVCKGKRLGVTCLQYNQL